MASFVGTSGRSKISEVRKMEPTKDIEADAGSLVKPVTGAGRLRSAFLTEDAFGLLLGALGLNRLVQHPVEALDEGGWVFQGHAFEQQCLVEE